MTIYKCKKCLKEFNRKCNYDYHTLYKKKKCIKSNCLYKNLENNQDIVNKEDVTIKQVNNTIQVIIKDADIIDKENKKEDNKENNKEDNKENYKEDKDIIENYEYDEYYDNEKEKFVCSYCNSSFTNKYRLLIHLGDCLIKKFKNENTEYKIKLNIVTKENNENIRKYKDIEEKYNLLLNENENLKKKFNDLKIFINNL